LFSTPARISRPILVRVSMSCRPTKTITPTTTARMRYFSIAAPSTLIEPWKASGRISGLICGPNEA